MIGYSTPYNLFIQKSSKLGEFCYRASRHSQWIKRVKCDHNILIPIIPCVSQFTHANWSCGGPFALIIHFRVMRGTSVMYCKYGTHFWMGTQSFVFRFWSSFPPSLTLTPFLFLFLFNKILPIHYLTIDKLFKWPIYIMINKSYYLFK